jgi:hypothetical protein
MRTMSKDRWGGGGGDGGVDREKGGTTEDGWMDLPFV